MIVFSLPFNISYLQLFGLWVVAFLAGFVDSIAGGGGLIQLPGVMTCLPGVPMVTILAVNKTSSVFGTATAARRYSQTVKIVWKKILPIAGIAFLSSAFGAFSAGKVSNEFLRPLVIVLLGAIILFTLLKKDFGDEAKPSRFTEKQQRVRGLLTGLFIGFYDGFFGPGTGNFLIMALIDIFGLDFLHASASAKIVNFATNAAALLLFALNRHGNIPLGLSMACFNMLGARCGVKLTLKRGSRFVRVMFLIISAALLLKQIFQ